MDQVQTQMFEIGNENLSMKYFRQAAWYISRKKCGSGLFWINAFLAFLTIGIPYLITVFLPLFIMKGRLGKIDNFNPDDFLRLIIAGIVIIAFIIMGLGVGSIKSIMETAKNPDYKKTCFHYFSIKQTFKALLIMLIIGIFTGGLMYLWDFITSFGLHFLPLTYMVIGGIIAKIVGFFIEAYFCFRFFFSLYALVDQNCSPFSALSYSWKITQGHFWNYVWFNLYFGFFNILGALCLGLGLTRTLPMQVFAKSYYYYQLAQLYEKQSHNLPYYTTTTSGQKTSKFIGIIGLILGILINSGGILMVSAYILPRFTSHSVNNNFSFGNNQFDNQGLARDTARQVALSQIQTATASYISLHGKRPATTATNTNDLTIFLEDGLLSELPQDPAYQKIENAYQNISIDGDFLYIPVKKNGKEKGGVIFAAKMETQQKANYVSTEPNQLDINDDFENIIPCKQIQIDKKGKNIAGINNTQEGENLCVTTSEDQLWYIMKF